MQTCHIQRSGVVTHRWFQSDHGVRVLALRHRVRCRLQSVPEAASSQDPSAAQLVLADVRVVLVAPKGPANIGSVARACANFETLNLWLVSPRCDPEDGDVFKVACGERVLQRMRVVDSLQEALADTTCSIGFTRRVGSTRFTHASIQDLLREFPDVLPLLPPGGDVQQQGDGGSSSSSSSGSSSSGSSSIASSTGSGGAPGNGSNSSDATFDSGTLAAPVALVFGREESGLSEAELRLCSHAVSIPTGRVQASMNLSHAVAVVLSRLFEMRCLAAGLQGLGLERSTGASEGAPQGLQPVTAAELDALLDKAARIAAAAGVSDAESQGGGSQGNHGRRRLPLGHLRALLLRARANVWEVRSLHGLASAILRALGARPGGAAQQAPGGGGADDAAAPSGGGTSGGGAGDRSAA